MIRNYLMLEEQTGWNTHRFRGLVSGEEWLHRISTHFSGLSEHHLWDVSENRRSKIPPRRDKFFRISNPFFRNNLLKCRFHLYPVRFCAVDLMMSSYAYSILSRCVEESHLESEASLKVSAFEESVPWSVSGRERIRKLRLEGWFPVLTVGRFLRWVGGQLEPVWREFGTGTATGQIHHAQ